MKDKLLKIIGSLCSMYLAFGFFFKGPVSFCFFGEPEYPKAFSSMEAPEK